MIVLLAIALLFSVDRKKIKLRTVLVALGVQVAFGAIVLYWPLGRQGLTVASEAVQAVINSANDGISFLFGPIVEGDGSIFAFQVLPVIVFVAALTSVLFHIGLLQWVVRIIGGAFAKLFGTTTVESMNTAANIFLGHTEAPLLIKPYLKRLTQSELFAVMAGGMATVAGAVLVGYSLMGAPLDYLIAAAFMAAPGGLLMAKIIMPAGAEVALAADSYNEDGWLEKLARFTRITRRKEAKAPAATADATNDDTATPQHASSADEVDGTGEVGGLDDEEEDKPVNVIDAASRGAGEGLTLALNIGAMLLAFIALIALVNLILGGIAGLLGVDGLTLQQILGWVFAPVMFLIGVPWSEAIEAGSFVGQKLVLNEFVAFAEFGPVIDQFTVKTQAIVTFALTGFANFAAIAMQLGALGSLAPNQRSYIAKLGMRAVLAGTLANLMSGAIAGVMLG